MGEGQPASSLERWEVVHGEASVWQGGWEGRSESRQMSES